MDKELDELLGVEHVLDLSKMLDLLRNNGRNKVAPFLRLLKRIVTIIGDGTLQSIEGVGKFDYEKGRIILTAGIPRKVRARVSKAFPKAVWVGEDDVGCNKPEFIEVS